MAFAPVAATRRVLVLAEPPGQVSVFHTADNRDRVKDCQRGTPVSELRQLVCAAFISIMKGNHWE